MDTSHSQWQEIGAFNVSIGYSVDEHGERFLETRACDGRGSEVKWRGLAGEEVMAWMMEQATEVLASESVTETEERPSPLRPPS